jgi:hypothetical protein
MKNLTFFFFTRFLSSKNVSVSFLKKKSAFGTLAVVTTILIFTLFSACAYYRVTTSSNPNSGVISPLASLNKVFVIHSDSGIYLINDIKLVNDSIKGKLLVDYYSFPSKRTTFPDANSSNKYNRNKGDGRITNEVHLYLLTGSQYPENSASIALKDIYRCDVYNHDSAKTTTIGVLSVLGVLLSPFILIILILLALIITGNSCPYVYVNTGHGYVFAGEIYSGAIYVPLERHDYLNLPELVAVNGKYLLKITNELKEIQHTNLTELMVIDHPANSVVLVDKYGNCQTNSGVAPVMSATNLTGKDINQLVGVKDSLCYYGETPSKGGALTDGVIMSVDPPKDAKTAKVFIRAKNSIWLDNVYKNLHNLLGSYNDKWTEKQNKADASKLRDWAISQKIPLLLYVEKNGEWVYCDNFNLAGPMAYKDDVLTVDLKGIGNGKLRIKLESGSYFWEIDYVGVDFSTNIPVDISLAKLENAITEDKANVTDLLKSDDTQYYIQPETDNVAELSFIAPEKKTAERTVILHSKGYYQIIHESKGFPQIRKLKKIRKPGQFLEYSRELMSDGLDSLQIR